MGWKRIGREGRPQGIARYLISGDTVYIWCDGTQNLREWVWNFLTMTIQVGKKRYNLRDWKQAAKVIESLPEEVRYCSKVITSGYSRGGAIAICLAEALTAQCAIVFAPKRVGMFLPKVLAVHRRGDIVPYLPPWYSKYTFIRRGKWRIFWQAHKEAGKDAAAWRCEAERRPGALITILGGTRALTSL